MERPKWSSYLFELWTLLRVTGIGASSIAITMLVQDKICLHQYDQSADFCLNISNAHQNHSQIQDDILTDSTHFQNYKNLIECIPMVIWSLFVGSFLDRHMGGTKLVMFVNVIGDIVAIGLYGLNVLFFDWNSNLILLSSGLFWFTGGMAAFYTVSYRYIIVTNGEQIRPLRFMLFQFACAIGIALGTFLGGKLLEDIHTGGTKQIRTYYWNFLLYLILEVLTLTVTFLLENGNNNLETENILADSESNDEPSELPVGRNVILRLFNIDNVMQTFESFVKYRENYARLQIHLLFVILFCIGLITYGVPAVFLQFTEKVYNWNAQQFSTNSSFSTVIAIVVVTLCFQIIKFKKLTFNDTFLLTCALISHFANQLILGLILSQTAYFVAVVAGSASGLGPIAIRNKISKLVPPEESGKVFSLVSTIEALLPFVGSLIYTNIFSVSISSDPGLIFQFGSGILLLSLVLLIVQLYFCRQRN